MKPGHHTTHLISYVRSAVRANAHRLPISDKDEVLRILDGYARSTKFLCPVNGLFFEDDRYDKYWSFLKLPFKEVVLEYDEDINGNRYGVKGLPPGPLFETFENVSISLYAREVVIEGSPDGVAVIVSIKNGSSRHWSVLPVEMYIPYGLDPNEFKKNPEIGPRYRVFAPSMVENSEFLKLDVTKEEAAKTAYKAVMMECISLLQFCAAVGCSNVRHDSVPAPKFINAKRVARGEVPLYEYHVLTVDTRARNDRGDPQGGTHSSPRQHLRRGHVRRYQSGLTIWINSMTVGRVENGSIEKDYTVRV